MNINMNLPKLAKISKKPEHIAQQKQQLFSRDILMKANLFPKSTQSFSCFKHYIAQAISQSLIPSSFSCDINTFRASF